MTEPFRCGQEFCGRWTGHGCTCEVMDLPPNPLHWHDPDPDCDEPTCTVPPPCACGAPDHTGVVHRQDGPCYFRDDAALRDRITRALPPTEPPGGFTEGVMQAIGPWLAAVTCAKCGITRRATRPAGSRICSVIGNESLMEHVWTVTL